jgi:hypothetical protein
VSGQVGDGATRPLKELLEIAEVARTDDVWLMMDIEGSEWEVLDDLSAPLERFSQISVEIHRLGWLADPVVGARMLRGLARIRETHVPVYWHPNNFSPALCMGWRWVPDVLEVTYVAKQSFVPGTGMAPSVLTMPNDQNAEELPEPFSFASTSPLR